MTRPKDWVARIYDGPCKHDGTKDQKVRHSLYGSSYCPKCEASRSPLDHQWRVLEKVK